MERENTINIAENPETLVINDESIMITPETKKLEFTPEEKDTRIIKTETKKIELTKEEKDTINYKIAENFNEKLSNYFSKFTNDIDTMEKMKYEFSDFYYELEKIKAEITENLQNQKSILSNSLTARHSDKNLLTCSNAKSSKNNNVMRSKTPTKLRSNKVLDPRESLNAGSRANNETARNYELEKSKTPMKNLNKPKNPIANNLNFTEISKTSAIATKEKAKTQTNRQLLNESKLPDVTKSNAKIETGTKSTAVSRVGNPISNATSIKGTTAKRDMTPIVKKNKQIANLDISTISNLDNSMLAENKGNQTNRMKNAKVSQFLTKNNVNIKKKELNKTEVEISQNSLGAGGNKKPATPAVSKKNVKDSVSKPAVKEKTGKNPAKKDIKGKKANEEHHSEDADENKDMKPDPMLKKENSVTNILDIIAEKNKEVNIEEILSSEKKEAKMEIDSQNKINDNSAADHEKVIINNGVNEEEGKVNKLEENKDAEIKEEIPRIDEKPNEAENTKPIEIESRNSESEKTTCAQVPNTIPEYLNKRNKLLHQVILSQ